MTQMACGLLMVLMAAASVSLESRQQIVQARLGEIAAGVVVYESSAEIRIKTDPCGGQDVIVFRAPFRKTAIGPVRCGSQTLSRVEVEKQ